MARSFSSVKLISAAAAAADSFSLSIFRRGFAAAPQEVLYGREGSRVGMMGKVHRKVTMKPDSAASSSWAPDPVTGYYRPENCAAEIDPAELREMLLNQKGKAQHILDESDEGFEWGKWKMGRNTKGRFHDDTRVICFGRIPKEGLLVPKVSKAEGLIIFTRKHQSRRKNGRSKLKSKKRASLLNGPHTN